MKVANYRFEARIYSGNYERTTGSHVASLFRSGYKAELNGGRKISPRHTVGMAVVRNRAGAGNYVASHSGYATIYICGNRILRSSLLTEILARSI